jgi:squalene-associated FAD-dependent desaturase
MRLRGLKATDKLRSLKIGRAIRSNDDKINGLTVSQWLRQLGQTEAINDRFWHPLAIATLNESPHAASARMFFVVLRNAFGGARFDSSIGISRVGLSELYTTGASDFICSRGGQVRVSAPVRKLVVENNKVTAIEMKSGERVEGDYFISSVPHKSFFEIIPDQLRREEFAGLEKLRSSPILSINLWFDRPVTDRKFAGLLGTQIQWLFNKDMIGKRSGSANHVALIISAARGFIDKSNGEIVDLAVRELAELLPASAGARVVHSLVVREREATLSHTVESDSLRPGARTSVDNLILAGDWTDTGLPATIEGAVRSGHTAADLVCELEQKRSGVEIVAGAYLNKA